MGQHGVTRRHFFYGTLLAGAVPAAGFSSSPSLTALGYRSPNEKLNIASIGAGGKAVSDIMACARTENIVALCDVDEKRAERIFQRFPSVPKYKDFREMLDKQKDIEAVIVTIPDHMHATAALTAMEHGKPVYVQKPLARTVEECRRLRDAARRYGVATQMGNQGYSNEGTRQCAEMLWAGQIGNVTEVHAWTNRPIWPQGLPDLPPESPVPPTLDWNLWLGIAAMRPYSDKYAPFAWRGFYDFGCGALGDMACHILGAANLALQLGSPSSVECIQIEGKSRYYFPDKSVIRFDFPARGSMPPVKIFWHDGLEDQPAISGVPAGEILGDLPRLTPPRPGEFEESTTPFVEGQIFTDAYLAPGALQAALDRREERFKQIVEEAKTQPNRPPDQPLTRRSVLGSNGSLFIGDKGMLTTGTYGEYTRLVPMAKMKDYHWPPEFLTRSPGHYRDWIRAAKGGSPACSNFDVAAPFTEWVLLGAIAVRFEGRLDWDGEKMQFTNRPEANELLRPNVRPGWQLPG